MKISTWFRRRPETAAPSPALVMVEPLVADPPDAAAAAPPPPFDAPAVLRQLQACQDIDTFLSLLDEHLEALLASGAGDAVAQVLRQVDAWVQRQPERGAGDLARLAGAFHGLSQGQGGPHCRRALRLYEQALAEYRQRGQSEGTAILMNNMGLAYAELAGGEPELFRQAIPLLEEALVFYEQQTDAARGSAICMSLGDAYAGLAEAGPDHLELARDCYERARALAEAAGSGVEQAIALRALGDVDLELARFEGVDALMRSLEHYHQALDLLPAETEAERRGQVHLRLSRALVALAAHEGSARLHEALAACQAAVDLLATGVSPVAAAEATVSLAEIHLALGQEDPHTHLTAAVTLARPARETCREHRQALGQARAAEVLGRVFSAAGEQCERADLLQALSYYEEAARMYLRLNLSAPYASLQERLREVRRRLD